MGSHPGFSPDSDSEIALMSDDVLCCCPPHEDPLRTRLLRTNMPPVMLSGILLAPFLTGGRPQGKDGLHPARETM